MVTVTPPAPSPSSASSSRCWRCWALASRSSRLPRSRTPRSGIRRPRPSKGTSPGTRFRHNKRGEDVGKAEPVGGCVSRHLPLAPAFPEAVRKEAGAWERTLCGRFFWCPFSLKGRLGHALALRRSGPGLVRLATWPHTDTPSHCDIALWSSPRKAVARMQRRDMPVSGPARRPRATHLFWVWHGASGGLPLDPVLFYSPIIWKSR
mmetsp:Transcript_10347/g.23203  ORF Transcript_10347/g.23203 Transcript_10347/m.23203 type:complete len:206 (-) Transcript_10347:7-624(-)